MAPDSAAEYALPLRALLMTDSPANADLLLEELRRGGFIVTPHRVDKRARHDGRALAHDRWDIVISDDAIAIFTSTQALDLLRRNDDDTPFIAVSACIDEAKAVEAMKAGAQDHIWKDNLARLVRAVRRELANATLRDQRKNPRPVAARNKSGALSTGAPMQS